MNAWITDRRSRADLLVAVWLIILVPVISVFVRMPASHGALTTALSFIYLIAACAACIVYLFCLIIVSVRHAGDARNAAAVYWSVILGTAEVLILGITTFSHDRPKEILMLFAALLFCMGVIAVTAARIIGILKKSPAAVPARFIPITSAPFLLVTAELGASGIGHFMTLPLSGVTGISLQSFIVFCIGIAVLIPYTAVIFFLGIAVPRYALMSREERSGMHWFKRYLFFMGCMGAGTFITFVLGRIR